MAFDDLNSAISWCKDEEKTYPNYKFEVEDISGWEYYSSAGDDYPKFHVEEIEYNNKKG